MSQDQRQQWVDSCYAESDIDQLLRDPARSIVVSTYPGCGITTSLQLLRSADLLVFSYNPDQWPGEAQAFTADTTHFGQWMALICDMLTEELRNRSDRIDTLDPYQHQFIIWMMQRYLGRRQSLIWQGMLQSLLPGDAWERLSSLIEHDPIAYSDTIADLKHQLYEWISVAQKLGWRGIFGSIDISWWDWYERSLEARKQFDLRIRQLLTTLAPLEVPYFGMKLGLPARLLPPKEIDKLTRARIKPTIYPTTYRWSHEQLQQICQNLVALASGEQGMRRPAPSGALWAMLQKDIESIWGAACPAAATALAQIWSELPQHEPLSAEAVQALRAGLYRLAAPLRLDPEPESQIIRRGINAIQLDDMPFRIFQLLWQHRGSTATNDTLLQVAGTKANLDKIISRIREEIEPLYEHGVYIYLQRRPSSGTWLEKDACLFI